MKLHINRLIFLLLALGAVSCEKEVKVKGLDTGKYLIINAMLDDADSVHTVYLSWSDDSGVSLPKGAEVTLSVNGSPQRQESFGEGSSANIYRFRATIQSGDVIRIDARYGHTLAYAEVTVPQKPVFSLVDTLRCPRPETTIYLGESDRIVEFILKVKDIPGESSRYRLTLERDFRKVAQFETGREDELIFPRPDSVYVKSERLNFDIGSDPILLDDYLPESYGDYGINDIIGDFNPHNVQKVFSDKKFTDSEAEVKFYVDSLSFVTRSDFIDYWKWETGYDAYGNIINQKHYVSYDADIYPTARVRLHSLSQDAYDYCRALNACEVFGYSANPLTEPVIFPTNVEGGLGIVSAESSAELLIPFPAFRSDLRRSH
jgi:hypothetical protein